MEALLRKQTAEQNAKQIRLSNLVLDFECLWRFLEPVLQAFVGLLGFTAATAQGKPLCQDSLAEWSKALAQGTSPQGRGFEPHSCHLSSFAHMWLTLAFANREGYYKPAVTTALRFGRSPHKNYKNDLDDQT